MTDNNNIDTKILGNISLLYTTRYFFWEVFRMDGGGLE